MLRKNDGPSRWVLGAMFLLVSLSWTMIFARAEVSKPWISYNFSCNTTLDAGGEVQTMQWYQDFDFQTIFTIGMLDDYLNHIEDVRNQVSVNFNATNRQCDWVCRQNRCCSESNRTRSHDNKDASPTSRQRKSKSKIASAIEMISESLQLVNSNSSGGGGNDGCGCSNQILPIAMWEFYSESRYLGGCGNNGSAWTNIINRELNFTLCYEPALEAPIWVELDFLHHAEGPFLRFTYTNWNGTTPSPLVFEIPDYCQCYAATTEIDFGDDTFVEGVIPISDDKE